MLLRYLLTVVLCITINPNSQWKANALNWDDISGAFDDAIDTGSGIIDDIGDAWNQLADSVANAFTSLGSAITGVAASCASWLYDLSEESGYAIVSIYTISELATNVIDDLLEGFNETTWDRLSDGAKYVIYNLDVLVNDAGEFVATHTVEYIAIGSNFLSDLADYEDYMPTPFDVLEVNDVYTVVDCMDDAVLESAIEFAEYIATKLVDLGGDDLDVTPVFNTENIKDELNATYECLIALGKDITSRESSDSDDDDDNVIADFLADALSYFEFDELVHGIEIGFTACTLVCGSAGIGFAVAPETGQVAPYYVVSSGVETSSVVGASIEAIWNFYPNWESVAPLTSHVASFDAKISLPLIPISFGPTIALAINDSGGFAGFELRSDILDVSLGFNGAFGLGYRYTSSYWIESLSDIGEAWGAFEDVGEIAANNVKLAIAAFNVLKDALGSGGFISQTPIGTYSSDDSTTTSSDTKARSLVTSSAKSVTITCPSGEADSAGNASAIELGYIEINEVIYGNMSGNNWCNSSNAYSVVYDTCAWLANCSLDISDQDTSDSTFGDPECEDGVQYSLDIIYSCPSKGSVYDIGCYTANFGDIVSENWIQDYASGSGYSFVNDNWETRENSIAKCSKIAGDMGYKGFAIYNHGMCLVGSNLLDSGVYNEYNSSECPNDPEEDGLGDPTTMNMYIFADDELAFEDLGCYDKNYSAKQEMVSMEDGHILTQDSYSGRRVAVSKCAQVAQEGNYDGFALFDGGACYVSSQSVDDLGSFTSDNGTYNCGTGKGSSKSFNVYSFPYASLNSESNSSDEGLSTGAMIGIIVAVVVLLIAIVVGIVVMVRKNKKKNETDGASSGKAAGAGGTPAGNESNYVQMGS